MKKILIILLAIITLLAVAYFGFFKYRQIQANSFLIPSNTESLVKINVDELYKTIAISYLKHPEQYKGAEKKDLKQRIEDLHTGIQIPANIYLFTLKRNKENYFSKFKINDSIAFKSFVNKHFKSIKNTAKGRHGYAQLADSSLSLLFSNSEVVFGYHPAKKDIYPILLSVLSNQKSLNFKDSQFESLGSLSDHIAYQSSTSKASINFYDGQVKFNNEFITDQILPFEHPKHRKLNSNSSLAMWLNADFKADVKPLSKTPSIKQNFFKFYKGYLDIEWLKSTNKKDTIISFEFNENFEQVEKKQIVDRKIPELFINMDADAKPLVRYLTDSNLLDTQSNKISIMAIPLFQTYFQSNGKQIQLSTVNQAPFNGDRIASEDFFYLYADFNKLFKDSSFPLVASNLLTLKKLESKGRKTGAKKIKFETVIDFQNEKANALIQLVKMYQKLKSTPIQVNFGNAMPKN